MSEVRVVELKELGVSKEVFDKIYSMGEQDGRADAIDDLVREVKEHYTTKEITYYDGTTDTVSYVALALLEQIAENLKENKNDKR